jgi:hypothetical protein
MPTLGRLLDATEEGEYVKTAAQAAANWIGSAGRAQTDWATGVQGYSGDWAGATTRQQAVMLQNVTQAITNGTWAAGVTRVGTAGWKSRTVDKAPNYAQGFQAGASRQASAIAKILQAEASIVGSLPPRGTYDQNKLRATAVMDSLHALKGTLGAS